MKILTKLYFDIIEREERQQRMIFGFKNYGFSVGAFFQFLWSFPRESY